MGRRNLPLVRCHLTSRSAILASVGLGVLIAPGRALGTGRFRGVLWDIGRTQVAHHTAFVTGLVVILLVCDRLRERPTLWSDSFNGPAIDSNWLAFYQGQGFFGVVSCATMLVFLLLTAYFQPRGAQRALAPILIT